MHSTNRIVTTFLNTLIGIMIVFSFGCSTGRDTVSQLNVRTDYRLDQVYTVVQPFYLFSENRHDPDKMERLVKLGYNTTPTNLVNLDDYLSYSVNVDGVVMPGDKLKIISFRDSKVRGFGRFLKVNAVMVSGVHRGRLVELSSISKNAEYGYSVFLDPDCVQADNE